MICVFDVIEGPARGRRFWLRQNQRMAVGRISTADFSVQSDSHMSRHHLIFEANIEVIRVRDVGSANGTFVNEARVSNLELCAGDRIRAGLTTFEVSVLGDDEDPHKGDGIPLDSLSGAYPNLTVAGAPTTGEVASVNNTFDANVTKVERSISQPDNREPDARHSDPASTNSTVAGTVSDSPAPPATGPGATKSASKRRIVHPQRIEPPRYSDDVLTTRSDPLWWARDFEPSTISFVLAQRPEFTQQNRTIVDVLKQAYGFCDIAIVVNRAQLDPVSETVLTTSVDPKLVSQLSRTLCLIRCNGTEGVWSFLARSLRRDAFICLGVTKAVEASWLNDLLDCICYPSMLSGLVENGDGQVQRRLLMHVSFALFEKNRSGELCLLLQGARHKP